jgi:repressor LexA
MEPLSPRQRAVLEFIISTVEGRGVPPSYREIGDALGIRSTNGVSEHLQALKRKGYIDHVGEAGSARSLRVLPSAKGSFDDDRTMSIPVLGRVAAGAPILAVEDHDTHVVLDRGLFRASVGGEVFALVVRGDSMIDDGIFDGDFVFVQRGSSFRDGDITAVQVEGEATIKRLFRDKGRLRLEPANATMSPFWVDASSGEVQILGVVVAVFRRL